MDPSPVAVNIAHNIKKCPKTPSQSPYRPRRRRRRCIHISHTIHPSVHSLPLFVGPVWHSPSVLLVVILRSPLTELCPFKSRSDLCATSKIFRQSTTKTRPCILHSIQSLDHRPLSRTLTQSVRFDWFALSPLKYPRRLKRHRRRGSCSPNRDNQNVQVSAAAASNSIDNRTRKYWNRR